MIVADYAYVLPVDLALDELAWDPVEYRAPERCGCRVPELLLSLGLVPHDGSSAAVAVADGVTLAECVRLDVAGPGTTVCAHCVEEWSLDYLVCVPSGC